jgi:hypothetical protein
MITFRDVPSAGGSHVFGAFDNELMAELHRNDGLKTVKNTSLTHDHMAKS